MVLEDGETTWGLIAHDFQWKCAKAVFVGDPPNRWEGRPRGGSKTTDAAGIGLAAMIDVFPAGAEGYCVAADRDQARLLINSLRGLVMRTDALRPLVTVEASRAVFTNGSFLEVLPADGPSAWGLKPDLLIVDELSSWPSTANAREVWEAVTTAMGKKPGARTVVLSMAGSPHHFSYGVFQHAQTSKQWSVGHVSGPLAWTSPDFLAEQRALHPESTYRRLFLNEWVVAEDALASREDVEACCVLSGPQPYDPRHGYLITVDVGLKNDRTVVAVTHPEDDLDDKGKIVNRRLVLDQLRVWQGSRERPVSLDAVEAHVFDISRRYGNARALFDEHSAEQAIQRLTANGLRAEVFKFTTQSVGRLGVALHQAIRSHRLNIWRAFPLEGVSLVDELLSVKLVEKGPGSYRLDHASGRHDDMAVCLAMATVTELEGQVYDVTTRFFEQLHAELEGTDTPAVYPTALDQAFSPAASMPIQPYENPHIVEARRAAQALLCAHCGVEQAAENGFCLDCDPEQARERVQ
jgi:hypothetical protein